MPRYLALGIILVLVAALIPSGALAKSGGGSKIDKSSVERIATALANGESSVTLLFATDPAQAGATASALRSLGATVRYQDADVGYVRALLAIDKVDAASTIAGVLALEVDEIIPIDLPSPELSDDVDVDPPSSSTPNANPYMPTQDTGAAQFVAAHPTWDGRGVTIGQLDTGLDLTHPALLTTTTGERKVTDWVTMTDPLTDNDPTWIVMNTTVTVAGGSFTAGGRTYSGAPDGTWKFGAFLESDPLFARSTPASGEYLIDCGTTPPSTGGDLNRNAACGDSFAILWDGRNDVMIDSDADASFADERVMRPYRFAQDIGEFGHDNAATAIRESVPFVVQTDPASNTVNLGIASGEHATHVASIIAGHGLFADASHPGFDGAAPGAKLVSIRVCLFTAGCTAHALIEGMIFAVKNAHVDVVNMSIGGLPALNDGNMVRDILYNALIDKWGAQIFISAGNSGPGVNTVGDPSVATKVMSVGAYWSRASALANYGATTPSLEALHDFSSRGPREDGGFKPDIVAPGNAVGAVPTWQPQQCLAYTCPVGYGLLNGTSMAAPQAAGAAGLLVSAAKQTGIGFKPAQIRQAMRSSARFLTSYGAHEQGNGLIDVGGAWALLERNVKTGDFFSGVPVNTLLSGFLATPFRGLGIYEREGVKPGDTFTRTYTFGRTDGGQATFNVSWIGNAAGKFSANKSSLTFDKKSTATLDVTFNGAAAPGAYSAILVLDDPRTAGIDYETMNTVIVSAQLTAANGYTAMLGASMNRFEDSVPTVFYQVPDGSTALKVDASYLTGRSRWIRINPWGLPLDAPPPGFTSAPARDARSATASPVSGAWEVGSNASRAAAPATSTMSFTARAYKATFDPTTASAPAGTPVTFTLRNEYAAGTMFAPGGPLASIRTATGHASTGSNETYDITLPAGTTALTVRIGNAADLRADLDLYVYDCTDASKPCVLRGQGTGSTANETVIVSTLLNPGHWKAVVNGFSVPAGTTTYTYTDSFANPDYGTFATDDTLSPRAIGASWTIHASATTGSRSPEAGRSLRATVNLRLDSNTGAIISSATLDVTP